MAKMEREFAKREFKKGKTRDKILKLMQKKFPDKTRNVLNIEMSLGAKELQEETNKK
jgi:hypothetical protein